MEGNRDEQYMKQALQLAQKGEGYVAPNPMVGAVIVKDGRIIGSGYHEHYGGPHAEVNAIADAKEDVAGATTYVTLEPCSHYGKTPPCADLLVEKKLAKVVVGSLDPNPLVAGKGIQKLKEAGIEVVSGVLEAECNEINRVFRHYITTKQPYVVMKTAMTLDGKIATATGESQWISGEASRKDVHRLRHKYTGIMVGINTIIHDNARLTCRMEQGKNPVRIVVDSCLRIALTSNVLKDQENNQTILATTNQASPLAARKLETFGSKVLYCSSKDNRVDLNDLMNQLGAMGVDSILLEGGATLNDAALRAGIVQEVVTYIAPKMIGGAVAPTPVGGIGVEHLQDAYQLGQMKVSAIGDDIKISAYIQPKTKIQPTEAN